MAKKKISESYYDFEGKALDFVHDNKNLKKIRSKNLRQFCKFYRNMEIAPLLNALMQNKESGASEVLKKYNKMFGSYTILAKIIDEETPENIKAIIKKYEDENKCHIRRISKRAIYDYMNARKFIRACKNIENEMMMNLIKSKS